MHSGVSVQLPMVLLAVQEQFSPWTAIGVDCSDQICDLAIRDKPKCIKLFLAFTLISDTWSFNCKCSDSSWFKMTPSDNFEHVRLHDPRWHLQHHMLSFNICEHSTYLCTGDPVSLVFQSPPPVSDTKIQLTSSTVLRSVQPQSQFNKGVLFFCSTLACLQTVEPLYCKHRLVRLRLTS